MCCTKAQPGVHTVTHRTGLGDTTGMATPTIRESNFVNIVLNKYVTNALNMERKRGGWGVAVAVTRLTPKAIR